MTAAATVPPASRIEAAANCAEPANVVIDITIGREQPHAGGSREHPVGDAEPDDRDRERGHRSHAVAVGSFGAGRSLIVASC